MRSTQSTREKQSDTGDISVSAGQISTRKSESVCMSKKKKKKKKKKDDQKAEREYVCVCMCVCTLLRLETSVRTS